MGADYIWIKNQYFWKLKKGNNLRILFLIIVTKKKSATIMNKIQGGTEWKRILFWWWEMCLQLSVHHIYLAAAFGAIFFSPFLLCFLANRMFLRNLGSTWEKQKYQNRFGTFRNQDYLPNCKTEHSNSNILSTILYKNFFSPCQLSCTLTYNYTPWY